MPLTAMRHKAALRRAVHKEYCNLMQSPEHCLRRAEKLRLALLMTDDANAAARLRALMQKYRARALKAEQQVLGGSRASSEAGDPIDLPKWSSTDRWT
jgi:hypothetical protein